jgi:hypothetical protein
VSVRAGLAMSPPLVSGLCDGTGRFGGSASLSQHCGYCWNFDELARRNEV